MKTNKTVKIISGYRGIDDYVRKAGSNSDTDLKKLWDDYVIAPYWDEWAAGEFNEKRIREEMSHPICDMDKALRIVEILRCSNIEPLIQKAYDNITDVLPPFEGSKAICIYGNPGLGEDVQGVVGSCVGDNILIQINPLIEGWEHMVPWVLAHEYHHSLWGYNYYYTKGNNKQDLLTSLIVDGQADSFAKSIYNDVNPYWINALTEKQETEQWAVMKDFLESCDIDIYIRFFFGDDKTNTPKYTAYTIGFNIIQAYMKTNPGITFAELLDKDSREILSGGYLK